MRKVELGKNGKNLAIIMKHKGKLWTLSHNSGNSVKHRKISIIEAFWF